MASPQYKKLPIRFILPTDWDARVVRPPRQLFCTSDLREQNDAAGEEGERTSRTELMS